MPYPRSLRGGARSANSPRTEQAQQRLLFQIEAHIPSSHDAQMPRPEILDVDQMKLRTALGIGCCQILAMIPGVSRAGATIMGAMMLRVDRAAATQFSFFLAVPTMLGATVYDLYKNRAIVTVEGGELIAIGFVVAFVCALFVVRTLVGFVSRHGFGVFAWYRIAIGSVALLLLVMSR